MRRHFVRSKADGKNFFAQNTYAEGGHKYEQSWSLTCNFRLHDRRSFLINESHFVAKLGE